MVYDGGSEVSKLSATVRSPVPNLTPTSVSVQLANEKPCHQEVPASI